MTESTERLCRLEDLADPGSRGFTVRMADGAIEEILVVRRGTAVFAYRNQCPHTGGPLDWRPDEFLNLDGTLIQCSTHMALFRIEDGHCVSGPCTGQALVPVALKTDGDWIEILVEAV